MLADPVGRRWYNDIQEGGEKAVGVALEIARWEPRCLGPRLPRGGGSSVERLVSPLPGCKSLSRGLTESMMAAAEPVSGESRLREAGRS
jgi:hypothetical protein